MKPFVVWFSVALCSWGVWWFGSMLWRMLKTRQFEASNSFIVRANEHPGSFRLTIYLTTAVIIGMVVGAILAWKRAIEFSLN